MSATRQTASGIGGWLVVGASAAGLVLALLAYFVDWGVNHTIGALIVTITTAIMLAASLLVALARLPRWLRILLLLGIAADIIGTGVAAYFLETDILLGFMGLAAIGFVVMLFGRAAPARPAAAH